VGGAPPADPPVIDERPESAEDMPWDGVETKKKPSSAQDKPDEGDDA
jgi:hypothetical protein